MAHWRKRGCSICAQLLVTKQSKLVETAPAAMPGTMASSDPNAERIRDSSECDGTDPKSLRCPPLLGTPSDCMPIIERTPRT